ncbi:hypothetical protein PMAYCL1PPCAC_30569, partial [Pristionchus mayeri]
RILEIYDAVNTALVGALLLFTTPLAIAAYSRLLMSRQIGRNYSIRMVVLNGADELLNCFLFTFGFQLVTFAFASPLYSFLMRNNLAWTIASLSSFISVLSIHTRFYVAVTRLSAMFPSLFRKLNSPIIFLICLVTTISGTIPMIMDIVLFNTFNYVPVVIGEAEVFIPYTERNVEFIVDINHGHAVIMALLTLLTNLLLSFTLFRKGREVAHISSSRKNKQERGLVITSIVSYLIYMVYFIDNYITREFEWTWAAYSQFLFLGISCHSPFWCLILFSGSVRATILKRRTTVETRTIAHSFTVQHK